MNWGQISTCHSGGDIGFWGSNVLLVDDLGEPVSDLRSLTGLFCLQSPTPVRLSAWLISKNLYVSISVQKMGRSLHRPGFLISIFKVRETLAKIPFIT